MMGRHLLTYMLPNLAQAVASFGTVAVLTRFMTPAEYGRYAMVYAAMTLVQYLTLTWVEAAAARFYSDAAEKNDKPNHFATLIRASLWCSLAFAVLCVAIIAIWPGDLALKLTLAAAFGGVLMRTVIKIALETRRMAQEATRFALVDTTHTLLGFAAAIGLVVGLGMGPEGAFLGLAIGSLIVLFIEGPALWLAAKGGQVDPVRTRTYFAYGAPLAAGLILNLALTSSDRFVIAPFLGEAEVGAYAAGYQVAARILDIIFAWGSAAITPLLVAAYERGGAKEVIPIAHDGYAVRLGIGAPAAVGIALLAQPICGVLIGENLRAQAIEIVPWIALAGLLTGMCDYFSEAFMLTKKAMERALLMLVPTVLNIGLNIVLLPRIGLMGAVVATVSAYGLGMVLLAIVGRRHIALPIPLWETAKIGVACAVMAVVVHFAPDMTNTFGNVVEGTNSGDQDRSQMIISSFEIALKATLGAIAYGSVAILLNLADARTKLNALMTRASKQKATS
jgi:O-antigen/teichoic acid export membrane protein